MDPDAIVLSPGPCTPNEAGICLALIERVGADRCRSSASASATRRSARPMAARSCARRALMHGKISEIRHTGRGVFRGINGTFRATRYHSLTIAPETMPDDAGGRPRRADDGVIMGVMHKTPPGPRRAVPPRIIASEHGHQILQEFPRPRRRAGTRSTASSGGGLEHGRPQGAASPRSPTARR